jgi:hypothetical protein
VGELYGPGRMVIIYIVGGVIGFTVSSLAGHYLSFLPPPIGGAAYTLVLRRRVSACWGRSCTTAIARARATCIAR